jgi:RHS repeat-associated protein
MHTRQIVWFGNLPVAQYDVEGRLDALEEPIASLRYTFTDHLGTPILQTDESGSVTWRAEYDPHGTVHTFVSGTRQDQPLRFPGQEDAYMTRGDVGDYYNIFRWYRAGWGRYTQADPIPFERAHRAYSYVESNPENGVDPRGLYAVYDYSRTYGIPDKQAFKNACIRSIQDKLKGRFPAGACNFVNASASCGCSCESGRYAIDPIKVYLVGDIFYFSGDWSQMPKANDTNVVNAQTAYQHELGTHILPSLSVLDPIVSAVEGSTYGSEPECTAACSALSKRVGDAYHKKILATQADEIRKYQ